MNRAAPVDGRKALRQMALLDPDAMTLKVWRETRDALTNAVRAHGAIRPCCQSCAHFDTIDSKCDMHGPVPHEFTGQPEQCEDWILDPIPF